MPSGSDSDDDNPNKTKETLFAAPAPKQKTTSSASEDTLTSSDAPLSTSRGRRSIANYSTSKPTSSTSSTSTASSSSSRRPAQKPKTKRTPRRLFGFHKKRKQSSTVKSPEPPTPEVQNLSSSPRKKAEPLRRILTADGFVTVPPKRKAMNQEAGGSESKIQKVSTNLKTETPDDVEFEYPAAEFLNFVDVPQKIDDDDESRYSALRHITSSLVTAADEQTETPDDVEFDYPAAGFLNFVSVPLEIDDDWSEYSGLLHITSSGVTGADEQTATSSESSASREVVNDSKVENQSKRRAVDVDIVDSNNNNEKRKILTSSESSKASESKKSPLDGPRGVSTSSGSQRASESVKSLLDAERAAATPSESEKSAPKAITTSSESRKARLMLQKSSDASKVIITNDRAPDALATSSESPRASESVKSTAEAPVPAQEDLPLNSPEDTKKNEAPEEPASPEKSTSQDDEVIIIEDGDDFRDQCIHTNIYTKLACRFLERHAPTTRGANFLLEFFSQNLPYLKLASESEDSGIFVVKAPIQSSKTILEVSGLISMASEVQESGFLYDGCATTTNPARILHISPANASRSVRKSCQPNATLKHVVSRVGRIRIFLYSTKLIRVGGEVMLSLDEQSKKCALHDEHCPKILEIRERPKKVKTSEENSDDDIELIALKVKGKENRRTASGDLKVSSKTSALSMGDSNEFFQKNPSPMSPRPEHKPNTLPGTIHQDKEHNDYTESAFKFISGLQEPPESDEVLNSFDAAIAEKKVCRLIKCEANAEVLMSAKAINSGELITELIGHVEMAGEVEDSEVGFKYSGLKGDIWITPINATKSIRRSCRPNAVLNHTFSESGGIRILVIALCRIGRYQEVTLPFYERESENLEPQKACIIQGCAIHEMTATRKEGKPRKVKFSEWKEFSKSPMSSEAPEAPSPIQVDSEGLEASFEPFEVSPPYPGAPDTVSSIQADFESPEAPELTHNLSQYLEEKIAPFKASESASMSSEAPEAPPTPSELEKLTRNLSDHLEQKIAPFNVSESSSTSSEDLESLDIPSALKAYCGTLNKLQKLATKEYTSRASASEDSEASYSSSASGNLSGKLTKSPKPEIAPLETSETSSAFGDLNKTLTKALEVVTAGHEALYSLSELDELDQKLTKSLEVEIGSFEAPELTQNLTEVEIDSFEGSEAPELTLGSSSIIAIDHDYVLTNNYSSIVTRVLNALPKRIIGPEPLLKSSGNQKASQFNFFETTFNVINPVTILKSTETIQQGDVILEMRGHVKMSSEIKELTRNQQGRYHFPIQWMSYKALRAAYGDHMYPKNVFCLEPENDVKFVRRSCQPNAVFKHAFDTNANFLLFLVATQDISKDEEITVTFDAPSDTPRSCSAHGTDKKKCFTARKRSTSKRHGECMPKVTPCVSTSCEESQENMNPDV